VIIYLELLFASVLRALQRKMDGENSNTFGEFYSRYRPEKLLDLFNCI